MNVAICGFVSTLTEKLTWLYQQREWTRQELLLIVLVLSVLLLVILRRRRKKSARTIHPEQFANYSSVIGASLAEHRHGRRHFADSRKVLAANGPTKHEKSQKLGKVPKPEQRSPRGTVPLFPPAAARGSGCGCSPESEIQYPRSLQLPSTTLMK